jgi:hypothetical protein
VQLSKEDHALIALVQHPDWTDSQIGEVVHSTAKQMKRWATFNAARIAQTHYQNRSEGWC